MFTHAFVHEADRKHPKHTMPAHSQEGKRTQNPFAQAVAERVETERTAARPGRKGGPTTPSWMAAETGQTEERDTVNRSMRCLEKQNIPRWREDPALRQLSHGGMQQEAALVGRREF